jgi:hypothetical protein
VDDSLNRWHCSDLRSGPADAFVLLVPACDPRAAAGFIVLPPIRPVHVRLKRHVRNDGATGIRPDHDGRAGQHGDRG